MRLLPFHLLINAMSQRAEWVDVTDKPPSRVRHASDLRRFEAELRKKTVELENVLRTSDAKLETVKVRLLEIAGVLSTFSETEDDPKRAEILHTLVQELSK